MTNSKISKEDFDETKILLFLRSVDVEIFKFLKFVDIIDEFNDSHKGNKHRYIGVDE